MNVGAWLDVEREESSESSSGILCLYARILIHSTLSPSLVSPLALETLRMPFKRYSATPTPNPMERSCRVFWCHVRQQAWRRAGTRSYNFCSIPGRWYSNHPASHWTEQIFLAGKNSSFNCKMQFDPQQSWQDQGENERNWNTDLCCRKYSSQHTHILKSLQQTVHKLVTKSDVENRLPEGVEGDHTAEFAESFFKKLLKLTEVSPSYIVERTHRVPLGRRIPGVAHRPFLVRFLNYRDRDRILSEARKHYPIKTPLYISSRISQQTFRSRGSPLWRSGKCSA